MYKFVKIEYKGEQKWAKFDLSQSYEDFVQIAKDKFPNLFEDPVEFSDANNCSIDPDIFIEFIGDTEKGFIFKVKESQENGSHASENTTVTWDISASSSNIETGDTESEEEYQIEVCGSIDADGFIIPKQPEKENNKNTLNHGICVEALRDILVKKGAIHLIKEYDTTKKLIKESRRLLVNLWVSDMVKKFGLHPLKTVKMEYASAIIGMFPKLQDPYSPKGYEAFYHPEERSGYIENRLRFIRRTAKSFEEGEPDKKKSKILHNESSAINYSYFEEDVQYLKNAVPRDPLILQKFKSTSPVRRKLPEGKTVLELFPRFLDTPGLILYDFNLIFPGQRSIDLEVEVHKFGDTIIEIYRDEKKIDKELLPEDEENLNIWDKPTRILLILLQLLPPTAKGRKKGVRDTLSCVANRLIVFKKTNTSFEEIIKFKKTNQPFLIASGDTKRHIKKYVICVDDKILAEEDVKNIWQAFDMLFKSFFVFNLSYDPALECFFNFMQVFFYEINIDSIKLTSNMRELRTKLLSNK